METAETPRRFAPNAIHMVRTTEMIHVQLSQMADQKASILMGASFVTFTIMINQGRSGTPPLPLLILGLFAFGSAVMTVLAIIPKTRMPAGVPLNLLFFGSFTQLSQDDFVDRMIETMADEETMLRAMAVDLYGNGQVLQRKKYRRLELAYKVFLTGLIVSALAFVGQHIR
ncbi:MAG: hypothetical protein B7Y45_04940 [Sphingomonas sp. 28-66-16]|nr:MAG: hypothetical protein B7Y45_04940 [Sphingomonas sp. 28-66-16]